MDEGCKVRRFQATLLALMKQAAPGVPRLPPCHPARIQLLQSGMWSIMILPTGRYRLQVVPRFSFWRSSCWLSTAGWISLMRLAAVSASGFKMSCNTLRQVGSWKLLQECTGIVGPGLSGFVACSLLGKGSSGYILALVDIIYIIYITMLFAISQNSMHIYIYHIYLYIYFIHAYIGSQM